MQCGTKNKTAMKKIKNLQVGDIVTYYTEYSSNPKGGYQTTVEKIGRQYITTANNMRFNKETGYGEYGKQLFVGTVEEFEAWMSLEPTRLKQRSKIEHLCRSKELDVPELTKIINFIQSLTK